MAGRLRHIVAGIESQKGISPNNADSTRRRARGVRVLGSARDQNPPIYVSPALSASGITRDASVCPPGWPNARMDFMGGDSRAR